MTERVIPPPMIADEEPPSPPGDAPSSTPKQFTPPVELTLEEAVMHWQHEHLDWQAALLAERDREIVDLHRRIEIYRKIIRGFEIHNDMNDRRRR